MKICWDNLERVKLTKYGDLRLGGTTYVEKEACKECGDPYLTSKHCPGLFCSLSCSVSGENNPMYGTVPSEEHRRKLSKRSKGNKYALGAKYKSSDNVNWKGGVKKKDLPLYDTYAHQIDYAHEVRSTIKDGIKLLEVRCKNCNNWFVPKATNVQKRIRSLLGKGGGANDFYCSEKCSDSCSVFKQVKWPKGHKPYEDFKLTTFTKNELKIWREEVLKRADYKCEYCGKKATIAHHSKPKKLEPFFALDPYYGIACCEGCHIKYGHKDECSATNIARIDCK